MSQFVLTSFKQQEINDIWYHSYGNWRIENADAYLNDIGRILNHWDSNSQLGAQVNIGVRSYCRFPINSHVIYYKIGDDILVDVIRILNLRMDVDLWLK